MTDEFEDRSDAGVRLARALSRYRGTDAVVLGMARGGIVAAVPPAETLGLPLVALVVQKLGAPENPELAIGAVSETGVRYIDDSTVAATRATSEYIEQEVARKVDEARRRRHRYMAGLELDVVRGRTAIVIDDGIATGSSAVAAVRSVRDIGARQVVLATPVASREAVNNLRPLVDDLVVLGTPDPFMAVGLYYRNFEQITDEQVVEELRRANRTRVHNPSGTDLVAEEPVEIQLGDTVFRGVLSVPSHATGVVLFAHGSGSGRTSPRNRAVAGSLGAGGFATLLLDLLTDDESYQQRFLFDVHLLAERLLGATRWLSTDIRTAGLPLGYFGASTGAGAALVAAARNPDPIRAVVSRGGRPDLAGDALEEVRSPTLLIVGGNDEEVLALNEAAAKRLRAAHDLAIIPGATHLFEEQGALEEVSRLALSWFQLYLHGPTNASHAVSDSS